MPRACAFGHLPPSRSVNASVTSARLDMRLHHVTASLLCLHGEQAVDAQLLAGARLLGYF